MKQTHTLTKDEILGKSVNLRYDYESYKALSLDGRRSLKNKEYYRALAEKTSDEAYLWLQLGMHWKD
jgi:hypothetical protein